MEIALANVDSGNLIQVEGPEGIEEYPQNDEQLADEGREINIMNDQVQIQNLTQIINMNDKETRIKIWSIIFFIIFIADMISISYWHVPSHSDDDTLNPVIIAMTANICLSFPIIFIIETNKYIRSIAAVIICIGASLYVALAKLDTDKDCETTYNDQKDGSRSRCILHCVETKIFIVLLSLYFAMDIWKSIGNSSTMRRLCLSAILCIFAALRASSMYLFIDDQSENLGKAQLFPIYTITIGYTIMSALCLLSVIINCCSKFNKLICIILIFAIGAVFTYPQFTTWGPSMFYYMESYCSLLIFYFYMELHRSLLIFVPMTLLLVFEVYPGTKEININERKQRYTFWSIIYIIISVAEMTVFISLNFITKTYILESTNDVDHVYIYYILCIVANGLVLIGALLVLMHFHLDEMIRFLYPSTFFVVGNAGNIGVAIYGMKIWCTDTGYVSDSDLNTDQCRMPFIAPILFSSLYGLYLGFDLYYKCGDINKVRMGVMSLFLCIFGYVNGVNTAYYDNNSYLSSRMNVVSAGYLLLAAGCTVIFVYVFSEMKSIQLISQENKASFHKFMGLLLLVSVVLIHTVPWIGLIENICLKQQPAIHWIAMYLPAVLCLIYDLQYV